MRCTLYQELRPTNKLFSQPYSPVTHLVPHVGLIVKARRRTEDLAVRVHKLQLVSSDVHGIYCSLQQVQALMTRGLQTVLCRQVGSQSACQASMVT